MRISRSELQAVDRAGLLTRYAILGPVAFLAVRLPATGTTGTGMDVPCLTDHHGLVVSGTFTVEDADGHSEAFGPGDVFYVPPGPPSHVFRSTPGCLVEGFAALPAEVDTSAAALEALGFEAISAPEALASPPPSVALRGSVAPFHTTGRIEVDGSIMGPWLFVRARFAPRAGYTAGWCDQVHWGVVLEGTIAINHPDRIELAGVGDIYLVQPGHRFTSPDGATIADYTAMDRLDVPRVPGWRRTAAARAIRARAAAPRAINGEERPRVG